MNVEHTIHEVESIYRSLTGQDIRPTGAELPPETDPDAHVDRRYRELRSMMDGHAGVASETAPTSRFFPPADVEERENEIRVEIDLPGVPKNRVQVSTVGACLVVRGERPAVIGHQAVTRSRERPVGTFVKAIVLPQHAAAERAEATLRDGVLTITMPLDAQRARPQEVRVELKS